MVEKRWLKVLGRPRASKGPSGKAYARAVADEARRICDTPWQADVTAVLLFVVKDKKGEQPDVDNLTKVVLDALKGIAYVDDRQVVRQHAEIFICGKRARTAAPILPPVNAFPKSVEILKEECTYIGLVNKRI
jgi:Holliday junction resolvase RusA-like endonuclease